MAEQTMLLAELSGSYPSHPFGNLGQGLCLVWFEAISVILGGDGLTIQVLLNPAQDPPALTGHVVKGFLGHFQN